MASVQKTLLTLLLINTIIILAPQLYELSSGEAAVQFETYVASLDTETAAHLQDLKEEGNWYERTAAHVTDAVGAIFNTVKMGIYLVGFFIAGMIPIPLGAAGFTGRPIEIVIAAGLNLLRVTFILLIMLEVWMLWKNQKTS